MASIEAVHARQILDSRGNSTSRWSSSSTTGPSAGPAFLAARPRRVRGRGVARGRSEYGGKAVTRAVDGVSEIQVELLGHEADDQRLVDQALLDLDRTPCKSLLGANAIIGVSMAVARAAAESAGLQLFRYLGGPTLTCCPCR